MKTLYFLLGLTLLCPLFVFGAPDNDEPRSPKTDSNVTGHVLHKNSGEHLSYITISVKGTTLGTVTDGTGHYALHNLPEGSLILSASAVGYKTVEVPFESKSGQTLEINFELEDQTIDMDQIVVSATRNETDKKSSATIVNVLSTKLFESTASHSLAETLNFQSGIRMEYNCSNCGVPQLRINGLEGQYSQILLDSRPIFSSLAGVYGLEQLPTSMVERVEVIRGGGSALYGSNAIGGIVNIITKEPLRNSVSLSNTTGIVSHNTFDINTALNGSFVSDDNRAGVYLFGMVRDRDPYDRNSDGFSDVPKLSSETIGFRSYYKTSAYSKITAEYHHMREFRRGGNRMDRPPHEADIAEQLRHKINGGSLRFDLYTPDQRHRVGLYTAAQMIDRDSYFGTEQNPDAYGHTLDRTFVAGAQYAYSMEKFWFSPAELTMGVEFNHNDLHDQMLGYNRDLYQTSNVIGGYLQNEWKSEKFNFVIGGRLDKHNLMKKAIFSPRVNLRYTPVEEVGLRVSYSSGYRAPQAYDEDLHVAAVGGDVMLIELDPNLKHESSQSFSASADLYHNFGRVQANLLIEGFYTSLSDVFTLVEMGKDSQGNLIMQRTNASGATVKGLNFEGRIGIPQVVDIQLGFTLQQSRYKEPLKWSDNPQLTPQRTMFRSPSQYGYLTSTFTITPRFQASLFGNYTGKMLVQHLAGYIEQDTERWTPSFFDMGLKLAYTFRLSDLIRLEVNGGVKNLLDQFQKDLDRGMKKDAGYIYGPSMPRMYFFGVKFMI